MDNIERNNYMLLLLRDRELASSCIFVWLSISGGPGVRGVRLVGSWSLVERSLLIRDRESVF